MPGEVRRKAGTRTFASQKRQRDRELVDSWKRDYRAGTSDARCDELVNSRAVPLALLVAIHEAPARKPTVALRQTPAAPKHGRDGNPARRPTPGQLEVIRLYADGLTMLEAAARLWVTPQTVSNRIQRAYQRTGASNLPHLVAVSIRKGWIL